MRLLKSLFERPKKPEPEEQLVLVFIPSLVAVLTAAENKKGYPLEEHEVVSIHDNAICMAVKISDAFKAEEARGYPDIVPEKVWEEWKSLRPKLGF
jgi:hypothetical protein